MKKKTKLRLIILSVFIILIILIIPGFYNGLCVKNYIIQADKINNSIRIALISDLHSCKYGEKEQELIEAVNAQNPDVIMMTGDIFDDNISDENTEYFIQGVAEKYPCYYVTGNHEYWSGRENFLNKLAILEKYEVNILSGELDTITLNDETINICGINDPDKYLITSENTNIDEQLSNVKKLSQNDYYTILLSHRPEFFESYVDNHFDLVLCGHAHGGQWRIPGLLNGLYAPNQGLFPKYAGGEYKKDDTTMIVSRGLARESTRVPRFYNRPELVIIDLT